MSMADSGRGTESKSTGRTVLRGEARRAYWAAEVAAYRASGRTQGDWCAERGYKVWALRGWLYGRYEGSQRKSAPTVTAVRGKGSKSVQRSEADVRFYPVTVPQTLSSAVDAHGLGGGDEVSLVLDGVQVTLRGGSAARFADRLSQHLLEKR
jgi:hypothetical protein